LTSHLDSSISENLLCLAKYDIGDDIVTDSADEDQEWFPYLCSNLGPGLNNTNGFFEHFLDPDEPNFDGTSAYDKGFSDPNTLSGYQFTSSYNKAKFFWDNKVLCHYIGRDKNGNSCIVDKDQAYYWLGRIAHLLEDFTFHRI
jgi:hypothetical protein